MASFRYALMACGLSQQEAADFVDVNINTIKSWCAGRANPPLGVWQLFASLFEQVQNAAEGAADVMLLDGIDPRAYSTVEADLGVEGLPLIGAVSIAGAMALLMSVRDQQKIEE